MGKKCWEKTNKENATNQIQTTPSLYDDEQIQAVCFIICSPVERNLGTVFLELLMKKWWKTVVNSLICKVLAYESRL